MKKTLGILMYKFSRRQNGFVAAAIGLPVALLVMAAGGDIQYALQVLNGVCSQNVNLTALTVQRNGISLDSDKLNKLNINADTWISTSATVTAKSGIWDSTAADSHQHGNKATLDDIAADSPAAWDAAAGVESFNGRTGAVTPQAGDYTVGMVTNAVADTDARLSDARAPTAHTQAASTIIQSSTLRMVSDVDTAAWNAKQAALTATAGSGNVPLLDGVKILPLRAGSNITITSAADSVRIDGAAGGGSSSLPEVTSMDSGVILTGYYGSAGTDTAWAVSLPTDYSPSAYTYRITTPVTCDGAGARIKLEASSNVVISHAAIGEMTTAGSTAATPTPLKFGGADGITISSGTVRSDYATFDVDSSRSYVVILDIASGTTGKYSNGLGASVVSYIKASTSSYNVADISGAGYSAQANTAFLCSAIEVQLAVTADWRIGPKWTSLGGSTYTSGGTGTAILDGTKIRSMNGGTNITVSTAGDSIRADLSGVVPIANGGTGASTAAAARTALNVFPVISGTNITATTAADSTRLNLGTHNQSASTITSGNLDIARLPAGGNWTLSSDLNINSNTLVVDQSANTVGINTASPGQALDVNGNIIATQIISRTGLKSHMTTDSPNLWLSTPDHQCFVLQDHADLSFLVDASWAGDTPKVKILSSGKVGIGTASPGAMLDISNGGYQSFGGALRIGADVAYSTRTDSLRKYGVVSCPHYGNSTEAFQAFGFDSDGTDNIVAIGGVSSGFYGATKITFNTNTNDHTTGATERMVIDSSGKVGIGTASPTHLLTMGTDSAWKATEHWTTSSDERLKEDIAFIASPLGKIKAMKGRTWKWKDHAKMGETEKLTHVGLVAQEVETVFPEWVGVDAEGNKTVTVKGDTALFIEAIKAQQVQIDKLMSDVEELKNEISKLKGK